MANREAGEKRKEGEEAMNLEIKNRFTGNVIVEVGKYFSLKEAVEKNCANLSGADLYGADLSRANLSGADLYGADLSGANLYGADLYGANGINPYLCTPLLLLHDQPGTIRAYKLVNEKNEGPYNGGIVYKIGETYEVKNANTDPQEQCAAGINLATLDWCMKNWREGYRIFIAEFTAEDIAVIPTATDGKFRVRKCTLVGEKDLVKIGLIKAEKEG
jgi:hypothetical protein